ncbi:hypothetical protein [Lacticaseibacillus paracasei]|uniref:hypothetical protein n=2 Tax=Lacticaseibacillus paracasei TaxID=1597 RepID=UPI000E5D0244|nr:hypothetical protein [Lacticaseibacillus paracasei]MCT3370879.1 hypothetical protein [Lacticaseibacillus paracasei]
MTNEPINERYLKEQQGKPSATIPETIRMLEIAKSAFQNMPEQDEQVYQDMKDRFPATDEPLNIEGSAALLQAINEISEKKFDFIIPLKDIEITDFPLLAKTNSREVRFNIKEADTKNVMGTAVSTYGARKQFLDLAFSGNTFAERGFKRDATSEIIADFNELIKKAKPDEKYRFRLIQTGELSSNEYLLRSVSTKEGYKVYDNGVVLYMSLRAISDFSQRANKLFYVENAHVTDSRLDADFRSASAQKLNHDVSVQIGIHVSNSEIADSSATFTVIYWITNKKQTITLADGPLFSINHHYTSASIAAELRKALSLNERSTSIYKAVNEAQMYSPVDEISLEKIFQSLIRSTQKLPKNYRNQLENLKEIATQESYSLLQLFGKLQTLADETKDEDVIWYIRIRLNKFLKKEYGRS